MTTSAREQLDPDTASGVLAGLREAQEVEDRAAAEKFQLAVSWAAMHSVEGLVGPVSTWEHELPIAGEGAPLVAEFCVPELACALGLSPDAGRAYLGDAVETRHRLPRCWARVVTGDLRVWKARRIAQATVSLSPAAAGFVDVHVAPVAHKIGPVQLDRLIEEARTRFDPDQAEARRVAEAECRRFDVYAAQVSFEGTVEVSGVLDLADALDLEDAVRQGAADLAALGDTDTLDVRRSTALGDLARRQPTLDLTADAGPRPPEQPEQPRQPGQRRQLVLHVHLADAAIARVEQTRSLVSVAQVQTWCTHPDTKVVIQPVIDLHANPHTDAYEIPDRIRDHVILRDHTCVFPFCDRPARGPRGSLDQDHAVPWPPGPTEPANLAPLCRRHHRAKTHAAWTYTSPEPGVFLWRSPHGYHYARDGSGTTDLT